MDDEERAARRRAQRRERYANDPDYREKKLKQGNAFKSANRDRINAAARERYAADPDYRERKAASGIRTRYGLSAEEFQGMLISQHHACGICEEPFTRTPCVDHCHLTGLVRSLLCQRCNLVLGHLQDNPAIAAKVTIFLERWFEFLFQLYNTEEIDMTSNENATEESKASRLMRKAILHELHQPFGVDPPPPTDRLQAIARALVAKAEAQDIQAIKEVLDRIDGKTPSAPNADPNKEVNVSWKFPFSKLNPPTQIPTTQDAPEPQPPATRSYTRRASSSSRSTSETSGSPAS